MLTAICKDILKLFQIGIKGTNRDLFDKAYELSHYFIRHEATIELLEPIFALERKLIVGKGPHKHFVEERVFNALSTSVLYCVPESSRNGRLLLDEATIESEINPHVKLQIIHAKVLVDFSIEVFKIEIPRDNFNSKRKSMALELIGKVAAHYCVPQITELCILSLKSNKSTLIFAVDDFFEVHRHDQDLSLSDEMVKQLDVIITKTKDRYVAVTALNLQVKFGVIGELTALSKIDKWKERNKERSRNAR